MTLVRGDTAISAFLETRGFLSIPVDDADPASEARDAGLVVISASVNPATVADKYRDVPVPVVVMESSLFDDMKMTGPMEMADFGATSGRELNVASVHPVAAGLSGRIAISAMAAPMSWGKPAATAEVIATLATDPARAAVFAYDDRAMMVGQFASARRVGFFATEALFARLTPDGLQLFEAAIEWAWSR
jgi:hypothetical protein